MTVAAPTKPKIPSNTEQYTPPIDPSKQSSYDTPQTHVNKLRSEVRIDEKRGKGKLAVALISGGMDSVTLAYLLAAEGYDLHLLSVDYGQKHKIELTYAAKTEAALVGLGVKCSWDIIDLTSITRLLVGSSLTDKDVKTPDGLYNEENMRITVVPNRNATMLAAAWAVAVAENASLVGTAVHGGDHMIYPDCRPVFISSIEAAFKTGNQGFGDSNLYLFAPFLHIGKHDIVTQGATLFPDKFKVPYKETWSCYKGGATADLKHVMTGKSIHCGRCGTCTERKEAFRLARVYDPTTYADTDFKVVAFRGNN